MTAVWLGIVFFLLAGLAVWAVRVLSRTRVTRPYPRTVAHLVHDQGRHRAVCWDGWEGREWPDEADAYADAIWHDLEAHPGTSTLDGWDGLHRPPPPRGLPDGIVERVDGDGPDRGAGEGR